MNRQLKFRAWDKLEKRFIYPDKGYQGHYVLDLNGRFQNLQNGSGGDEYVVQQWTGEFDRNKKEIYEGDIVRVTSEEWENENFIAEIVFIDAGFYAKVNEKDYKGVWGGDDIEVIGNIYQRSKQQIKNIAVRWSEFFDENAKWYNEKYKKYLLTSLFVDLLDIVKQKSIKVKCGIAMMEFIEGYVYYVHCSPNKSIHIGGCEIIPELDFDLPKFDMWYEDICLVGTSVLEKDTNITQQEKKIDASNNLE